ncbi:peptidyl-prolyl cis-trans isomerase C [Acidovorax sp. 93]|jgi:peptidyl-prolyl cis-trans isomerase C|nr:peptidyl-prolyl cis-trans isomerase C [Acidovorax sp. 93]RKR67170.1 peptidyl-prolyl cis-trans isomerase C [Acidovorax sp. 94]
MMRCKNLLTKAFTPSPLKFSEPAPISSVAGTQLANNLSFFGFRMKKQLLSGLVAAAVLGTLALPVSAQNVAIVNGKAVPKERVEALKQQVERSGRPVTPDIEGQIKEEVITREIFMQEAQKRGLEGSADYKAQMDLARQTILIRELFADYQKKNPVTDAEIQAEYDKFVAANSGKEYKASHILVEKEADAKAIIASIKKGAKFEDIAKKQSKDPGSGAKGGDLDWANPSSYVSEFTEALVKLQKGKMTDAPVKSQFGWHVIRLDDVRQAELPKLEEVKPQVAQQLQQQKLAKFQEDLRAKAKVE